MKLSKWHWMKVCMYACTGNFSSVSLTGFKAAISEFAPQFGGYNQHDSQVCMYIHFFRQGGFFFSIFGKVKKLWNYIIDLYNTVFEK